MTPQHEEALRALRLADRDIAVFERIKDVPEIHLSMVCFHAQQAVEKSLKAVLYEKHLDFRRTHDLAELAAPLHRAGCPAPYADAELIPTASRSVTTIRTSNCSPATMQHGSCALFAPGPANM